jgi:hypothetical protein
MTTINTESSTNIILPPRPPPTICEEQFVPGEFKYINCSHSREMLQNAYNAISQTENWSFVKKNINNFMCSDAPEVWIITKKMVELGYDSHSGFSFGWTMRQMQFVAKNGEKEFKNFTREW